MKRILPLCVALMFVFSLAGCNSPKAWYIVQISDTQLGFMNDNRSMTGEIDLFTSAIAKINRLQPAAIVMTGDFVNSSRDVGQTDQFGKLCSLIAPAIPVYKIPGNHDIGDSRDASNRDYYQSLYGPDRFSTVLHDVLLIGINTCLIKDSVMPLKEEQLNWLADELSQSGKIKHKLVFGHHPFFMSDINEPENYSNLPKYERKRYDNLFNACGVSYYFAGHLHDNAMAEHGKVRYVTTSALGRQLGRTEAGVRVIRICGDEVGQCYLTVPEIPSSRGELEQLFNNRSHHKKH